MAHLKEVADKAEVSPSTVSRVINNPDLVKRETREKVFAAMKQVGYAPLKGEALSPKHIIGLAIPDIRLDFVGELVRRVEQELEKTPFDLLLFNMQRERNVSRFFRKNVAFRKKVDALIVFSATLDNESVDFFRSMDLPIVLMQSRCQRERSISTNNYLGSLDAINFLISRGYQRIGFIGWKPENHQLRDRYNGYKSALEQAGLPYDDALTAISPLTRDGGYHATETLVTTAKPEAIFYATDSQAFGGYQYCRDHQIRIPDDLGMVGFDDLDMAEVIGLTTMRQFFQVKVEMAVSYLLGRLSGDVPEPLEEEFCVTPRLIVRTSTR